MTCKTWLQTSDIGKDERNAKNNHGVWYDAQTLSYAMFTENKALTNETILQDANRLETQMDSTGFFPLEMERTTSLHYSVFILNAFFTIAQLSEQANQPFWNIKTTSGHSLQKAFDVILLFIAKQKTWPKKDVNNFNYDDAVPLLLYGKKKFNCNDCLSTIKNNDLDSYNHLLLNLL